MNMLDSMDYELDFEKDLEEVRAASLHNYQTSRHTGYSATVIGGQYSSGDIHSAKNGLMIDQDEEFQGTYKFYHLYSNL